MKARMGCLCVLLALSCIAFSQQTDRSATASQVEVPHLLRFTGQLKDATGTVSMTFSLHKSQQDSAALWIETQNVKLDDSGKYSVLLGMTKTDGIPTELFTSGEAQWLGARVEGQEEQPRVLLVSVPYALKAAEAERLAGHAASEFVTSDKLTSVVQQQMKAEGTAQGSPKKKLATSPLAPTSPATNFADNTTNQVLGVTQSGSGMGLFATSTTGYAVRANSTDGTAIFGYSTGTGSTALLGSTNSPTGKGIYGFATATSGVNYGVLGSTTSPQGIGIYGYNNATSGTPIGILGATLSSTGTAIKAQANAGSGQNIGLLATSASPDGTALVLRNPASGFLINAQGGPTNTQVLSLDGLGNLQNAGNLTTTGQVNAATFIGTASGPGANAGYFQVEAGGGNGIYVYGAATNVSGGTGGDGVYGVGGNSCCIATNVTGGHGGHFYGGNADTTPGNGVVGVGGDPTSGSNAAGGSGGHFVGGNGLGTGVYAIGGGGSPGSQGLAAVFSGNISVTGSVFAGMKLFRIDHPLDPQNKYLEHTNVESSEMMDMYSGNARLDGNGTAVIKLPDWFEALNTDFRYQLTAVGAAAPNLHVQEEISAGHFVIAGGAPGLKVSWAVTAIRHDAYAHAHPMQVVVEKQGVERGHYLHPDAFGHPEEPNIEALKHPIPGAVSAVPSKLAAKE